MGTPGETPSPIKTLDDWTRREQERVPLAARRAKKTAGQIAAWGMAAPALVMWSTALDFYAIPLAIILAISSIFVLHYLGKARRIEAAVAL